MTKGSCVLIKYHFWVLIFGFHKIFMCRKILLFFFFFQPFPNVKIIPGSRAAPRHSWTEYSPRALICTPLSWNINGLLLGSTHFADVSISSSAIFSFRGPQMVSHTLQATDLPEAMS